VRKVATLINGESLPGQPIKTDFQNDIYIEGYRSLFAASGKLNRDEGIDITREDYKGTLKIELEFQQALPSTLLRI